MRSARVVAGLLVLGALSCSRGGGSANLLFGKPPARADGVTNPQLLTDGRQAGEGEDWNAPAAAILQSEQAYVDYDLGESTAIDAAYVQGDNNDDYVVSVSEDGAAFRELWVARPVAAPGLRGRAAERLGGRGRWIRLSARGGDRVFSMTELQLWSGRPAAAPARVEGQSPALKAGAVRTDLILVIAAFALVLFATREGAPARRTALLWLAPAAAALLTARAIAVAWPLGAREVSFARLAAAAIVLLTLMRGCSFARRAAPHQKSVVATCCVGALLALACFYNLGRPQFWHQGEGRPMFVHASDMRVYQPFAKYFDELRYDGIYVASLLAFAEDERGGSFAGLSAVRMRDLRDFSVRPAGELADEIARIRQRFTPERWAAFKKDIAFFRGAMGQDFLTTMDDHGANAPPAWVWLARLFVGHVPASETTLTIAGVVDGLLFLAMAWAIWASFGLLPMLVAMTVFGATELYMYGTNWAGATLRHDWLALLAFAACALRRRRWRLAGALLGFGTMLRVLPAAGLLGVAAPAVGWLATETFQRRRPGLRALASEHRAALQVIAAAAATMAATFIVTGALYGFGAWGDWFRRMALWNRDLASNEVSLRMLIGGADWMSAALMRERLPLYLFGVIGCVALVVIAARGRALEDAMLLGLPLILVLMHPVNYHAHFVFLLVLLGAGPGLLASAAPWLLMCIAGYWAAQDPDAVRRYEAMTVLIFAAVAGMYFAEIRLRRARPK